MNVGSSSVVLECSNSDRSRELAMERTLTLRLCRRFSWLTVHVKCFKLMLNFMIDSSMQNVLNLLCLIS
jgi:hypothetical protein